MQQLHIPCSKGDFRDRAIETRLAIPEAERAFAKVAKGIFAIERLKRSVLVVLALASAVAKEIFAIERLKRLRPVQDTSMLEE
jgi:hypothetical protein